MSERVPPGRSIEADPLAREPCMKKETVEGAAHKPRSVEITIEDTVCRVCQRVLEDGVEGQCSCQLIDEGEDDAVE
jgi:hypothetical protein